jgi:hypothetical protein
MNFKALSVEQMNRISAGWLDTEQQLIIAKIPQLAGMNEDLQEAHQNLAIYIPAGAVKSPALAENRNQAKEEDTTHDCQVRAAIHLLLAAKALAKNEEVANNLLRVLEETFPDGFGTTTRTYEEEAGAADLRQKRLTDPIKGVLKGLTFQGTNALEIVEQSINAGLALGKLEQQKRQLEQELSESAPPSAGDAKRAQYEWIDTAKLVVKNATRALKKQKLIQKEHDAFLGPLFAALEIAERRAEKSEEATPAKPAPIKPVEEKK